MATSTCNQSSASLIRPCTDTALRSSHKHAMHYGTVTSGKAVITCLSRHQLGPGRPVCAPGTDLAPLPPACALRNYLPGSARFWSCACNWSVAVLFPACLRLHPLVNLQQGGHPGVPCFCSCAFLLHFACVCMFVPCTCNYCACSLPRLYDCSVQCSCCRPGVCPSVVQFPVHLRTVIYDLGEGPSFSTKYNIGSFFQSIKILTRKTYTGHRGSQHRGKTAGPPNHSEAPAGTLTEDAAARRPPLSLPKTEKS